jgi:branched-chain amino acid transport system substrate-binding protein
MGRDLRHLGRREVGRRDFVLGSALLGLGASACSRNHENEIPIGAFLSLSGPDSTFGSDTREGMDLAVQEINEQGGLKGKKVRVIYEDDKSTTFEATQKVRQLIDRDKVIAVIGEVASSRSLVGGLIANKGHTVMITPSSTAVSVTKGREWVFRTCFTDEQQGKVGARFIYNELKKTRAATFFTAQDTYSSGLAASFVREWRRLGGTIVAEKGYPKGETSFRTFLSELKAKDPEIIFVPNYYNEMVFVGRHASELGIPGSMFFGGDGWDSATLAEGAGKELEGAHFTNHYAPDVPWENSKRFFAAFNAKYNHPPTSLAAQGYDSAMVLFDAIKRAPAVTRDEVRKALLEMKDFTGATGTMNFDADRNANKPIVIIEITNRAFKYAGQLKAD